MKTTIIFMILILGSAMVTAHLDDYPEMFFTNGEFNAFIVVGKSAPSMDVASAIELIPSLQALSQDRISGAVLDEDLTDYDFESSNIISMGTPCDNEITAKIMHTASCSMLEGDGYIYLFESELGKAHLIIAGGTPEDTRKAAIVLGNYQNYELDGYAFRITGDDEYEVVQITLPEIDDEVLVEEESDIEQRLREIEEAVQDVETTVETENKAEKLQQELDEEIKKIEEKNKTMKENDKNQDYGDGFFEIAWNKFKSWFSWFFQ